MSNGRRSSRPLEIAGWFNDGWEQDSIASALEGEFTEVNPYWFNLGISDGSPGKYVSDGSVFTRFVAKEETVQKLRREGILVVPTVGDSTVTSLPLGQVGTILKDHDKKMRLLDNLETVVEKFDCDGIDINFESVSNEVKREFTNFIAMLVTRFHTGGKIVSVTLQAAHPQIGEKWFGYDLGQLRTIDVDRFKIMLYDNHYDYLHQRQPVPIAPLSWCETVIKYMVEEKGLPPERTQIALHNYMALWIQEVDGLTYQYGFKSYADVNAQLLKERAKIDMQRVDDSPLFDIEWDSDAKEHMVSFKTTDGDCLGYWGSPLSIMERVQLALDFNLMGVAFWVLGREYKRSYDEIWKLQDRLLDDTTDSDCENTKPESTFNISLRANEEFRIHFTITGKIETISK